MIKAIIICHYFLIIFNIFLIIPWRIMKIVKNNENNYSNVSPSVPNRYHDHLQGHPVVINDAAKEFSTMLRRE